MLGDSLNNRFTDEDEFYQLSITHIPHGDAYHSLYNFDHCLYNFDHSLYNFDQLLSIIIKMVFILKNLKIEDTSAPASVKASSSSPSASARTSNPNSKGQYYCNSLSFSLY